VQEIDTFKPDAQEPTNVVLHGQKKHERELDGSNECRSPETVQEFIRSPVLPEERKDHDHKVELEHSEEVLEPCNF
jgi:hypothetical protein